MEAKVRPYFDFDIDSRVIFIYDVSDNAHVNDNDRKVYIKYTSRYPCPAPKPKINSDTFEHRLRYEQSVQSPLCSSFGCHIIHQLFN